MRAKFNRTTHRMGGVALGLVASVLILAAPATGYDGFEGDYQECIQGTGNTPKDQIVAACSRLIDNAATENEVVGYFYTSRALNNNDAAQNCSDARRAEELVETGDMLSLIKELQDIFC